MQNSIAACYIQSLVTKIPWRRPKEHKSQALCYLVKSALNSILEEPPTTSGATSSDNEQEVDSDDLLSPRELCALIPSDVNAGLPHFFSQGIKVHPQRKRRSVGLASRIRYMPKS
ncbi:unnamed protein product, partial [Porites evermanni]